MRILNRKKFIKTILFLTLASVLIIIVFFNVSLSHNEVKYKKIYVSKGDSLWSIAKYEKNCNVYFQDKDIRDVVYEIKCLNSLKNSELKIGEELNIPEI